MGIGAVCACAGVLLIVAFAGAIGLAPFYDDWVVPAAAAAAIREGAVGAYLASPIGRHWSPAWNLVALWNLEWAGLHGDMLIRALIIVLQGASLLWCGIFLRTLGASRPASAFGMSVLGLHHVAAAALYSFDTYSQVAADLAAWLGAGLAYRAFFGASARVGGRYAIAGVAAIAAGLLFKETAMAGAIAVLWLAAAAVWTRRPAAQDIRAIAAVAAAVVTIAVVFAIARDTAGVRFDARGDYRLCLACVPRNAAFIGGALALPVRTLTVVDAWRASPHAWLVLSAAAAGAGAICWCLVRGLWLRARSVELRSRTAVLAMLLPLSVFPVAVLGGIGELHARTGVFWLAVLLALAFDGWRSGFTPARRRDGATVAAAYVVALAIGLRGNLHEMRETGARAAALLAQYDQITRSLPAGSTVLVSGNPAPRPDDYSLYRMTSPERLLLIWLWAVRDAGDGYPDLVADWGNTERYRVEEERPAGPLFEVRHDGHTLTIARVPPLR